MTEAACESHYDSEALALAAAHNARLRMERPQEWTVRVWDNLGWHWALHSMCGWWSMHPSSFAPYSWTAFLTTRKGDQVGGRWAEHGSTPARAMRATWDVAKAELAEVLAPVNNSADTMTHEEQA